MSDEPVKTGVVPGEFPFPITEGPEESRYLTWVRNHSNYMAVRGLLDYVRAIGVLVRGALVNFLIGLPYLLLVAIAVAAFYLVPETPGLRATWILLYVAAMWILAFPLLTLLFRIARHRRSRATGTDSSVRLRDRYERSFGALLLAILLVAAFESLPLFLDGFHFWVYERGLGWPALASSMAVALALFGVSDKLLSVLGGVAKKVAFLAIGAVGLLVPLLVVLFVADFLVFTDPVWDLTTPVLTSVLLVPVGILLALALGLATRAFTFGDFAKVSLLLVGSILLLVLFIVGIVVLEDEASTVEANTSKAAEELWTSASLHPRLIRLTRDVAEAPSRALTELRQRLADVGDLAPEGAPAPGVPGQPAPGLPDSLADLAAVARRADLPALVDLVEEIRNRRATAASPAESKALADEVDALRRRALTVSSLLEYRDAEELLASLMVIPHEDVGALVGHGDLPRYLEVTAYRNPDYPVLTGGGGGPPYRAFADADEELWSWGTLVRDVRREVTAQAVYSPNRYPLIYATDVAERVREAAFWPKVIFILMLAFLVWFFCWFAVDVNLTSIHGLYRDRLASAFLIGADTRGDVDIEEDLDLIELSRHEAGSTAPYHLINVALNLQGSRDISVRDRKSDFFVFSKRFTGGKRTGYCRSETMEHVFPQMSLSSAMAISAAAASPNMGRATSPALVAVMTLLNVRLGFWVPNPGLLEQKVGGKTRPEGETGGAPGFSFDEVFQKEMFEIQRRWKNVPGGSERRLAGGETGVPTPTVENGLVGIGFSGGGIRSATVNLGITQVLHRAGIFDHLDYMSTVSGGGYLGSSLSSVMRRRTRTVSEVSGRVSLETGEAGEKVVRVTPEEPRGPSWLRRAKNGPGEGLPREYRFASDARLSVADGESIRAGQRLIRTTTFPVGQGSSFAGQFRWRVRPVALLREMTGRLDETHRWVNVSDGGHIENLAGMELLRRRCRYILIGDGEADPEHRFNGLATLIRFARIDLGVHIDLELDALRLDTRGLSRRHCAVGRIHYPGERERGYLLYMKSSLTGDEDEVIREYRHGHPTFPHESTADQFFDEGQFEAYRSLGQHIGEKVVRHLPRSGPDGQPRGAYGDLAEWFEALHTIGEREETEVL